MTIEMVCKQCGGSSYEVRTGATPDFEERARGIVAKIEHGDAEHRQWLYDHSTPIIKTALSEAYAQGVAAGKENLACSADEHRDVRRCSVRHRIVKYCYALQRKVKSFLERDL